MICLIILIIVSCHSTNYYEVNGLKNEILTRKQGNIYTNIVDYRVNNRVDDNNKEIEEKVEHYKEVGVWEREVNNMEDINSIVTALGSAIAGVYCLIKTIIAAIKKAKGN